MARCSYWAKQYPIAVGISRKGFLVSFFFGTSSPKDRDAVSKAGELALTLAGVQMIRTHDVAGLKHCIHSAGIGDW